MGISSRRRKAIRVLSVEIIFVILLSSACGCGSDSVIEKKYYQSLRMLVEYRNLLVAGAIENESSLGRDWIVKLNRNHFEVQNSGPDSLEKKELMEEKSDLLQLFEYAYALSSHVPTEGEANEWLDDFDRLAREMSQKYKIPIELKGK